MMNSLELKGGIIEMIAMVDNKEVLQKLYDIIIEIVEQTHVDDYDLTPAQEERLNEDIEASYKPENLVKHEEALQKMSKWLKK